MLVSNRGVAYINDFGQSKLAKPEPEEPDFSAMSMPVVSKFLLAPENWDRPCPVTYHLLQGHHSFKSDVYMMGCVLWESFLHRFGSFQTCFWDDKREAGMGLTGNNVDQITRTRTHAMGLSDLKHHLLDASKDNDLIPGVERRDTRRMSEISYDEALRLSEELGSVQGTVDEGKNSDATNVNAVVLESKVHRKLDMWEHLQEEHEMEQQSHLHGHKHHLHAPKSATEPLNQKVEVASVEVIWVQQMTQMIAGSLQLDEANRPTMMELNAQVHPSSLSEY